MGRSTYARRWAPNGRACVYEFEEGSIFRHFGAYALIE